MQPLKRDRHSSPEDFVPAVARAIHSEERGEHKAIMLVSTLQDCGIRCPQRQHIAEPEDFVVQFSVGIKSLT